MQKSVAAGETTTAQRILSGKVAIVTGSTSGIGLAIARAFAAAGMNVMLNGIGVPDAEEIRALPELRRVRRSRILGRVPLARERLCLDTDADVARERRGKVPLALSTRRWRAGGRHVLVFADAVGRVQACGERNLFACDDAIVIGDAAGGDRIPTAVGDRGRSARARETPSARSRVART